MTTALSNYIPTEKYGHSGMEEWEPLLERAHSLVPVLRERAPKANENRAIPTETMNDIYELRLLRHYQPAAFGGETLPWGIQFHLGRILAHGCPSTAWIASVVASQMVIPCRFPRDALEEIFADGPDLLMGMGSVPTDVETRDVDGGARVSGKWRFVSGVDHTKWIVLMIPADREAGKETMITVVPLKDVDIDDQWFVTGLKATGSKDVVLRDVFIPSRRTAPLSEIWADRPDGGNAEGNFIWHKNLQGYFGSGVIGPVVGMAEAGLEAYRNTTAKRVGVVRHDSVAESSAVQVRLAESDAEIKTARMLLENQIHFLRRCGETGRTLSPEDRLEMNRDRAFAVNLCVRALERLSRHMGALGIYEKNPVQLFHQDIRAAACQIAVNFDQNMSRFGKKLLGLEAEPVL